MDSASTQPPLPPHSHHHYPHPHHQPPPHQHYHLLIPPNTSHPPNTTTNAITVLSTSSNPPTPTPTTSSQHHQQLHSHNSNSTSNPSPTPLGFTIDPPNKKRGRPRKYSGEGDNNIALGLSPLSSPGSGINQKTRGRPSSSWKKQLDALGTSGVGFTPHVIIVKAGEDIAGKLIAFAQQGPRAVCILSANGAICNVTLRQPAMSTGSVTYEGRFEIISLSGSFQPSENSRIDSLSVSLAGSDGRVLGGNVAGMLMAASPAQVIVGSFISNAKKPKPKISSAPSPNILSYGAPVMHASPPSQGASSHSSGERSDSPLHHAPGSYNNAGQSLQQSMSMYPNISWQNSTIKTHPN